jgi:hypothetical protein
MHNQMQRKNEPEEIAQNFIEKFHEKTTQEIA